MSMIGGVPLFLIKEVNILVLLFLGNLKNSG